MYGADIDCTVNLQCVVTKVSYTGPP